jgi:hypothetical protein
MTVVGNSDPGIVRKPNLPIGGAIAGDVLVGAFSDFWGEQRGTQRGNSAFTCKQSAMSPFSYAAAATLHCGEAGPRTTVEIPPDYRGVVA